MNDGFHATLGADGKLNRLHSSSDERLLKVYNTLLDETDQNIVDQNRAYAALGLGQWHEDRCVNPFAYSLWKLVVIDGVDYKCKGSKSIQC